MVMRSGRTPRVVPAPGGEGVALVQAEQVGVAGLGVVLHQDDDVVHEVEQLLGYLVQRLGHELLEPIPAHLHRHARDYAVAASRPARPRSRSALGARAMPPLGGDSGVHPGAVPDVRGRRCTRGWAGDRACCC